MRRSLLTILLFSAAIAQAQDPIVDANKCFDEKNWECAVGKYREALADKKYQEKDLATIKYRISYGLKEQAQFDPAIALLKEVIVIDPRLWEAYWSMGWCYYSVKEYANAEDYYAKAMPGYTNDDKSLSSLYYGRGISRIELDKFSEALADFKEAMRLDSSVSNYYSYAGEASYNLKKYSDAIYFYQKAIDRGNAKETTTSARYYWIAESYLQLTEYAKAHEIFQKALVFNPANKNVHWGIAATYYNQENWTESIKAYTKTLEIYKDDTASLKEVYYWRGRAYGKQKDFTKAITDYDAALKIDRNYKEPQRQKAHALFNKKLFREAIPQFTSAIALFNGDKANLDDLYYFRGASYFFAKDTVNAEKDFRESLDLNNNLREPNIGMGHINFARKEYSIARGYYNKGAVGLIGDTAELSKAWMRKGISNLLSGDSYIYTGKEDLIKSLSYDSLNKEARQYLADAYYRLANFAMAEKELTRCVELYAKNKDSLARMYIFRGMARSQQKKYKDALSDYEASDKLKPFTLPADITVLAQIAFEVKEYEKASKIFTKLIPMYKEEQKNELMFAHFGRGRAAIELGNRDQAVKDLKKALELSPGNKDIQTWLAKAEALN